MNKNNLNDNTLQAKMNESSMKQKEYKTPTITNIGLINEMTLAGGDVPQADSGSTFGPS